MKSMINAYIYLPRNIFMTYIKEQRESSKDLY